MMIWPVVGIQNRMEAKEHTIFSIGHSTHPADSFINLLKAFSISILADVRNFPGSKRYPHFNKENLQPLLLEHHIRYIHFKELGGRRKPVADSGNTRWRNAAFRGYADYMETAAFRQAIADLEQLAKNHRVAFMCAEAVWWSCHRAL